MYLFKKGDRVRPANARSYAAKRRGTVTEVSPTGDRVRVLWEKQENGVAAKRTWMQPAKLAVIIQGAPDPFPEPDDRPAVGPGGWCLDTND